MGKAKNTVHTTRKVVHLAFFTVVASCPNLSTRCFGCKITTILYKHQRIRGFSWLFSAKEHCRMQHTPYPLCIRIGLLAPYHKGDAFVSPGSEERLTLVMRTYYKGEAGQSIRLLSGFVADSTDFKSRSTIYCIYTTRSIE